VNKRFNEHLQKLQLISTLSGSAPIQQGIAHYLQNDSYDNHLRKLRKNLEQRQSTFIELIGKYFPKSIHYTQPEGGYFLWVELPESKCGKAIYQKLLEDNITVAFGKLFSVGTDYENYLRLNTSLPCNDELEEAVKTIGELLH
ncbi:aminotransferase class I/II-fold pyridoxal phosphate-dependent enzyme, partial [Vibrio parahaemolyticus]